MEIIRQILVKNIVGQIPLLDRHEDLYLDAM